KISSFILKKFHIPSQKKYGRQNKDIETKQAILSAIVESSDDAIISKNLEGIITSWNFGAQKIFGYTEAEAIGKSIKMLIPEDRLVEEDHILGNIRSGKKVSHFQTWRIHKSGKEIPISITVSPVKDRRGTIIGASKIARDITEQVQAQYALKRNAENLETLNSIGKKISEKLDAASILQHVTDATTKITGASFGVFIYNIKEEDPQKSKFYVSGSYSRMEKADFVWKLDSALDLQIDQENKIINIHNSADAIENKKLHELFPAIKNYLVVPIISGSNELLGRLVFGHYNATAFTPDHASLVESIALQAAVALENSKLFEEIKGLNTKKDEFIALASHELKTPLTTIKGYLQLLNKKLAQSKDAIFVEKTLNQVEKLRILVDELLDVS
ncbi:PAS domain S-box protein, partial [Pseudoxanthomonas sp. SGD-10]